MTKPAKPNIPLRTKAKELASCFNPLNIPRIALEIVREEIGNAKSWNKTAEPRTKNLFLGVASITPGFVAAISGAIMYANNIGIVRDCNDPAKNSDPIAQIDPLVCDFAQDQKDSGRDLVFGGAVGMLAPGIGFVVRDGVLRSREQNGGPTGPKPVSRQPISR